jgi:hypothetical protein
MGAHKISCESPDFVELHLMVKSIYGVLLYADGQLNSHEESYEDF